MKKLYEMKEQELIIHLKNIYRDNLIEYSDSEESMSKLLDEIQKQNNNLLNDFKNSYYL